jgi:hypothetical protein
MHGCERPIPAYVKWNTLRFRVGKWITYAGILIAATNDAIRSVEIWHGSVEVTFLET